MVILLLMGGNKRDGMLFEQDTAKLRLVKQLQST